MDDQKIESLKNEDVAKKLNTNYKTGLTDQQVEERQKRDGLNVLPKGKVRPWYITFLLALVEPLQLILLAAAIISVAAPAGVKGHATPTDFIDFIVIIIIVVLDAILGTVQDVKAKKSVDALKSLSKPRAVVLRDGQQQEIDADQLVVGDVVIIEAGKYIPAELRIIECSDFEVDESILTGESLPVTKVAKPIKATKILAEQENICFMNSYATSGRAIGVVFAIGEKTEIGKIAKTINENKDNATPLEKKMTSFGYWISVFALVIAIAIFLILFFREGSTHWVGALMDAITLAIGVIPESLSAVVSVTLAFSTKRMAKKNVIVKKLSSVETLGSVNVICTDKTGTLTQNRMTVKKVIMDEQIFDDIQFIQRKDTLQKDLFLKALVLPNDSVTDGESRIGDPTELALVDYADKMGIDELKERKEYRRIDEIPFDSERKLMTTINKVENQDYTFTKGAIDELLKVCDYVLIKDKKVKLTQDIKEKFLKKSAELSDKALRVLGFAYLDKANANGKYEKGLIFIGAVGMIDPVRKSAVQAVKEAHDAGIQVVMITGDHAQTALAIARELDIAHSETQVLSSEQLEKYSDDELAQVINHIRVFARVNPEHKVRIVQAFKKAGNIVSMTGDGVNDAPSLSIADVGVGMGITGTDVAKQASDVILADDNFATMLYGVDEGRNVYQKIKRTIVFLLGVNLANALAIVILSAVNRVSPFEAPDILFINLVVESLLAICMGMGPSDNSVMRVPPIKGKNGLLKGLVWPIIKIMVILGGITIAAFYVGMAATPDSLLNVKADDFKNMKDVSGTLGTPWMDQGKQVGIHFNTWRDLLAFDGFKNTSNAKRDVVVFGRTAAFMTITVSPALMAHLVKLTNWKVTKRMNWAVNKPLAAVSGIALALAVMVWFIPGLNDTVFNLVSSAQWTNGNCWVIFASIGLGLVTPALMFGWDYLEFFVYNYLPKPWDRNRNMVKKMVAQDEQKRLAKEKAKRSKRI